MELQSCVILLVDIDTSRSDWLFKRNASALSSFSHSCPIRSLIKMKGASNSIIRFVVSFNFAIRIHCQQWLTHPDLRSFTHTLPTASVDKSVLNASCWIAAPEIPSPSSFTFPAVVIVLSITERLTLHVALITVMAYARLGFSHSWHHVRHWYMKCVLVNATEINMETNVDNRRWTVAAA